MKFFLNRLTFFVKTERRGVHRVVTLLIKDTLRYEPLPLIDKYESMWCKLFVSDVVLVIGVVYRPFGSPIEFLKQL